LGHWGLGIAHTPQSTIPNPQSPIPIFYKISNFVLNIISKLKNKILIEYINLIKYKI